MRRTILGSILLLSLGMPALAKAPSPKARPKEKPAAEEPEADLSPGYRLGKLNQPPKILGKLGILIDTRSGEVLWEKNARMRRPMASLTKVMTALLILESGRLDETVTASKNANQTHDSSMYLAVGEKLTLRDLLWGILLRSANDGCVAAAEFIDGSVPKFVAHMNRRAQELGLKDTHFVTPNGLNAPGHYSTPADLAKIVLEDMKYPLFNEMVRTKRHVIRRSIRKGNSVMISRSRILWRWPLADGVKTGYTHQAGHCFIGSATKYGWRLLSVVMNSPHVGDDTRSLLEYGFANFRSVKLGEGGKPLATIPVSAGRAKSVPVGLAKDMYTVIRRGEEYPGRPVLEGLPKKLAAPIRAGKPAGNIEWEKSGGRTAEAELVALKTVAGIPAAQAAARSPWLPLLVLFAGVGAAKYGTSAKNYRQRRNHLKKRGRAMGRRR
jgi:D-alanyl-D-alanine carboxypeptidase (penicillin-binding protein 5/6)